MPHFDAMIQQKILLKRKLLQNQAVVNLLCNVGNNVVEFENIRTGSKSPAASLIKTHFYVPDTQTVDKNFITMRSRVVYTDSNVVKETGILCYETDRAGQVSTGSCYERTWTNCGAEETDHNDVCSNCFCPKIYNPGACRKSVYG